MFEEEARKRQATSTGGASPELVTKRPQAGKARDEAAALMKVGAASVGRASLIWCADLVCQLIQTRPN
jgi:hypothetical protein